MYKKIHVINSSTPSTSSHISNIGLKNDKNDESLTSASTNEQTITYGNCQLPNHRYQYCTIERKLFFIVADTLVSFFQNVSIVFIQKSVSYQNRPNQKLVVKFFSDASKS